MANGADARGLPLLTKKLPQNMAGPDGAVIQAVLLVDANGTPVNLSAGSGGGTGQPQTYTYPFDVPSDTWLVQHNLSRFPAVIVVDSAGDQVFGDVTYLDANSLSISFVGAFSGTVFLN